MAQVDGRCSPFCALDGIIKSHEYKNVVTVYLSLHKHPRLSSIGSMYGDNFCPVEMTFPTFHSKGGALTEHLHQALYVYGECSR